MPIPRPRQAEILRALGSASRRRPAASTCWCPPSGATTSRARPTSSRRSRASTASRSCPPRCPSAAAAPGGLSTEQRLRRRADRRARRPRHVRDRGLELHRARRWPTACAWPPTTRAGASWSLENPMSEDHSVLRTTLARLAARRRAPQRRARARRPRALRGRRRLPRRGREAARTSTARSAACSPGACTRRRGAPPSPPRAGFFAAKGLLGAALDARARAAGTSSPRPSRSCIPGAARACWPAARTSAGSASCTRSSRARGTSTTAPRCSRSTSTACSRHADAVPRYVDLTSFPRAAHGPRGGRWPRTSRPRRVLAIVREAGGELLAGVRVFDLYRGEQVGEGRKSLALALAFRAPDRTLTDEDVAPAARAHRRRAARRAGRRAACLARSSPAPRATPARWPPRLLDRHPRFDLVGGHEPLATSARA